MNARAAQPSSASRHPASSAKSLPPLIRLRECIAALRVRTDAAQTTNDSGAAACGPDARMVPVFRTPVPQPEILSTDRDVLRRQERIQAILAERGALRLLGAQTGPQLATSIAQLHHTHPNFALAIDHVLAEEALARQKADALCGLRLLLVGGPGIGKTDFALQLAKLLGVPSQVLSLSSAQASAAIGGSEAYWSNSQPGVVWDALVHGHSANPIFVLDEIDKAPDVWGSPLGALFQLLEPRTAAIFCDKSVPWLPLDASRVSWVATANRPEDLHEAIRSRFYEIAIEAPTEDALREVVGRLYLDLLQEFGVERRFPARLPRNAEDVLLGKSVRDIKRLLRAALGQALKTGTKEVVVPIDRSPGGNSRRIGFV